MRDPSEVDVDEEFVGTMGDYLSECMAVAGHERWRWIMHPRFFYELRKMVGRYQEFGNPPQITYGAQEDTRLWGMPVIVTEHVEDVELEEIR